VLVIEVFEASDFSCEMLSDPAKVLIVADFPILKKRVRARVRGLSRGAWPP